MADPRPPATPPETARQDAISVCPYCRTPLRLTHAIGPVTERKCKSTTCRVRRFGGWLAVEVQSA